MMKLKNARLAYIAGALLGGLAVILGAMGAHALEDVLSTEKLNAFETAVRYQLFHAILLLVIGHIYEQQFNLLLSSAIILIFSGIILFSGSIFLLSFTSLPIGWITPIGGLVLIIGWGLILVWAIRK